MQKLMKRIEDAKYLVFLDLEGTQESHEMIAIGAVIYSLKKDKTLGKRAKPFKYYVKSKKRVGFYVTKLTGITDELLEKQGLPFDEVLEKFKRFVGRRWKHAKFVTFGQHDMRIFNQSLYYTPEANKNIVRSIGKNHIDLSDILSEFIKDDKNNPLSLVNYCKLFDIEFSGVQHDPLADAYNLAKLYDAFIKNPDIVDEHYLKVLKQTNNLPLPIKQVISQLVDGEDVSYTRFLTFVKQYVRKGRPDGN